ncbi:hypothetical protein PQR57_46960 [Paraburkholderia dipogonis]|uniref:DUF1488 family protein n=1 Tax=Paraburkholderia dipogonis TaxID=1211383 RepID=A0ABW9B874_9BURK
MKIELCLPGEQSDTVFAVADEYTITVTRNDVFACNKIEAETAMRMWLDTSTHKPPRERNEIEQHLKRVKNGERMDALYAVADAALREAVPAAVLRHRAARSSRGPGQRFPKRK